MALRVYEVALTLVEDVGRVVDRIERKDRDLGRQLRKCSSSVVLNVAEGMHARGGNRDARWATAMGSARETRAVMEVAARMRYLDEDRAAPLIDRADHVAAMLYRLLHC